jgi:dipeptidase D
MAVVSDPFAGLEPVAFWRHFDTLTKIPRATFEEEAAVAHVVAWAGQRGLETRRDGAGNLVVDVPATAGRERAPTVILQGHLDIVCERDPASPNDPREGRIRVVRDGEWLRADGTTLGADNGVAIAAVLALVEEGAPHGPLELLMTVEEEVGMAGAAALAPELTAGGILLNLDSEEDATLTVGCAGGADSILRLDAPREPVGADEVALRVTVGGGRGGHSGGDIAAGRSNAIKLLARALGHAPELRLAALDGGASRNAIPRDAAATIVVAASEADAIRDAIVTGGVDAARAYERTDPAVRVTVAAGDDGARGGGHEAAPGSGDERGAGARASGDERRAGGPRPVDRPADAWTAEASARIVDLIAALPSGPLGLSAEFPGVVETSSSLGVAATDGSQLTLRCLSRSANDALIREVTDAIAAAGRLAGADVELGRVYPGWRPDLDSPVLATATRVHERLFGKPPHVSLIHGGLEPAIIGARKPGLDMISFGPQIEGPHAPGERVHAGSAERFMRLLAALVDELSR